MHSTNRGYRVIRLLARFQARDGSGAAIASASQKTQGLGNHQAETRSGSMECITRKWATSLRLQGVKGARNWCTYPGARSSVAGARVMISTLLVMRVQHPSSPGNARSEHGRRRCRAAPIADNYQLAASAIAARSVNANIIPCPRRFARDDTAEPAPHRGGFATGDEDFLDPRGLVWRNELGLRSLLKPRSNLLD